MFFGIGFVIGVVTPVLVGRCDSCATILSAAATRFASAELAVPPLEPPLPDGLLLPHAAETRASADNAAISPKPTFTLCVNSFGGIEIPCSFISLGRQLSRDTGRAPAAGLFRRSG